MNYPVLGNVSELYAANLSNSNIAKRKTVALFKKLRKLDLVEQFHSEILKGVSEGNMRFLSKKEELEILSGPHCFSGLNYAQKPGSTSQRVRPVADSSLYHPSSSLNSRLPVGPSFIGSLRSILRNFRLKSYALVFDMSRAYRSMRADYTAGCLRPSGPL